MTDEEKAEFKRKMAEAKAKKKSDPSPSSSKASPSSARTVSRAGRTQREIDLEKQLSGVEDERDGLKTRLSEFEKFIENLSKPSKPKASKDPEMVPAAGDGMTWDQFAEKPWG